MKIAIDIRHLATPHHAGVGRYTIELIKQMIRQGGDDHFFLFAAGSSKTLSHLPTFDAPNVTVVKKQIPNRFLFFLFFLKLRTIESFLPKQPDLWFFPNHNISYTKLPYALTVHDLSFAIFPSFFTRKDRLRNRVAGIKQQTRQAKHLFAVSESTKRDLMHKWQIPEDRITVTSLGVDEAFHPKQLPSDRSHLARLGIKGDYLLCLCTREPRKNLEAVLQALAQSPQSPQLVIAGKRGWKSEHIDRLTKEYALEDRVTLIGYVKEQHKPALYRHAKALLFPSFYEGYGLPVIEASACGAPIIASNVSSLPEVVSQNATLVDPFNVTDIVQALDSLNTKTSHPPVLPTWNTTAKATLRTLKRLT